MTLSFWGKKHALRAWFLPHIAVDPSSRLSYDAMVLRMTRREKQVYVLSFCVLRQGAMNDRTSANLFLALPPRAMLSVRVRTASLNYSSIFVLIARKGNRKITVFTRQGVWKEPGCYLWWEKLYHMISCSLSLSLLCITWFFEVKGQITTLSPGPLLCLVIDMICVLFELQVFWKWRTSFGLWLRSTTESR